MNTEQLYLDSYLLLEELIRIPSFSREEEHTAQLLSERLTTFGVPVQRLRNNVWCSNKNYHPLKPTLLLNSHHDTVRPSGGWTTHPFSPVLKGEKLIGLGVNDAGASLVALLAAFRYFYDEELPFNLVFAATAEEEISGSGGIESIIPQLGNVNCAMVGEPTQMQVAVAEKGLLVLDCIAHGIAGHAARNEGENAILNAVKDIEWFSTFQFEKFSEWLGAVKMSVTIIQGGTQHNVIPSECRFTVDIRLNEQYSIAEVLEIIRRHVSCEIVPRSNRLTASGIPESHPLVQTAKVLGRNLFGSPTLSDQALIPVCSIKMGPGDSARSHTADEYILLPELREGIEGYIQFINALKQHYQNETLAEDAKQY